MESGIAYVIVLYLYKVHNSDTFNQNTSTVSEIIEMDKEGTLARYGMSQNQGKNNQIP